jgi:checkpoint serine/threonine-protein kinase
MTRAYLLGSYIQSRQVNVPKTLLDKRTDNIAVDIEALYPDGQDGEEFCFEELRAIRREIYDKDWNLQRKMELEQQSEYQPSRPRSIPTGSRTPIKVKTVMSPSPNKGKIKRRGKGNTEPTMTFHTRAATDEIYDLFNQPLNAPGGDNDSGESDDSDIDSEEDDDDYTVATQSGLQSDIHNQDEDDDEENEGSVHSDWSDFTLHKMRESSQDVATGSSFSKPTRNPDGERHSADQDMFGEVNVSASKLKKLSIFKDHDGESWVQVQSRKIQIPPPPEDFDPPRLPYHLAKEQGHVQSRLPYMTPIVERTESLPPTTLRSRHALASKTPCRSREAPSFDGGRLLEESDDDTAPTFPLSTLRQPALSRTRGMPKSGAMKEPIIADILCNPIDAGLRKTVLDSLKPPLSLYDGFYQHTSRSNRGGEIRKFCKAIGKRDADKATLSLPGPPTLEFITGDGGSSFTVKRELGKGAYAPVFLVENNLVADAEDEEIKKDDQSLRGRHVYEALKMEHPPSPWEFYVMRQIMIRLSNQRPLESVAHAHEMHLFTDEGFLILDYKDQGTVLDLVNTARSEPTAPAGTAMDELLAMFLTVELLRTVEAFHDVGIIHGDLKPDNCLVRFEPVSDAEWDSKYRPDGSGGWAKKGVSFIDFGRGIDMTVFSPSVQFVADWKTDQQDCAEMREMRPWTYQVDYHGLAAIIYTMLFGKFIETVAEKSPFIGGSTKHYKIATPLKRYWQQDIWAEIFNILLNPLQHTEAEELKSMPITTCLANCRARMEQHLVTHCDKGVGLKNMIRKMEVSITKKR